MESKFFETNTTARALPSCSRLYHLAPIEAGTLWIESLTSYINRLAWAYRVSSNTLAAEEILPHLSKSFYLQSKRPRVWGWCRSEAMSLNGVNENAEDWSATLMRLTARSDIQGTTCIPWASGLAATGLLHRTARWCSACYYDWQQNGQPIYQPLLWMLHIMKMCPKHRRLWEERCPICHMSQSVLTSKIVQPGYCTQCRTWLGTPPGPCASNDIDDEFFNWQVWVANVVAELLQASNLQGQLAWERFGLGLIPCIEAARGKRRLARLAGIGHDRLCQWIHNKRAPSFKSVLECCYTLGISPLQIMTGDPAALKEMLQEKTTDRTLHFDKRTCRPVDRERAREILQEVIEGRVPPRSVNQIERQMGLGQSSLWYCFSQECHMVSALYKAASTERSKERVARECAEVQLVTRTLYEQAIFPTYRQVRARLSDPNLMRRPEVRASWHTARRELGLEG